MNPFQDVRDFHDKFGVPALGAPGVPSEERVALRERLVSEEYAELMTALGYHEYHSDMGSGWARNPDASPDLPEIADAIADLIYVAVGTAHEFGIPLGHVWNAVHASNMKKEGGGSRADGKILKPQGWVAPDIEGVLKAHGWRP